MKYDHLHNSAQSNLFSAMKNTPLRDLEPEDQDMPFLPHCPMSTESQYMIGDNLSESMNKENESPQSAQVLSPATQFRLRRAVFESNAKAKRSPARRTRALNVSACEYTPQTTTGTGTYNTNNNTTLSTPTNIFDEIHEDIDTISPHSAILSESNMDTPCSIVTTAHPLLHPTTTNSTTTTPTYNHNHSSNMQYTPEITIAQPSYSPNKKPTTTMTTTISTIEKEVEVLPVLPQQEKLLEDFPTTTPSTTMIPYSTVDNGTSTHPTWSFYRYLVLFLLIFCSGIAVDRVYFTSPTTTISTTTTGTMNSIPTTTISTSNSPNPDIISTLSTTDTTTMVDTATTSNTTIKTLTFSLGFISFNLHYEPETLRVYKEFIVDMHTILQYHITECTQPVHAILLQYHIPQAIDTMKTNMNLYYKQYLHHHIYNILYTIQNNIQNFHYNQNISDIKYELNNIYIKTKEKINKIKERNPYLSVVNNWINEKTIITSQNIKNNMIVTHNYIQKYDLLPMNYVEM